MTMTFSPELEARFEKFLAKYPADRKRSAMIPMLIYAQDEVGSITTNWSPKSRSARRDAAAGE
jgi:NADH:ubiquinone oxidoreductase subunit E